MDSSLTETKALTEIQVVVFQLAACELALPIGQLREIVRVSEMTFMPKAPRFLAGIANLRGRIIPVLDLRKRFEMPVLDQTDETRILIVEIQEQVLGLLVDKVVEVLKIQETQVEPAGETILNLAPEFLSGTIRLKDRLILLFRAEKITAMDETKNLPEFETDILGEGERRAD